MFQTTFERSYSKKPRPKLIFKMKKYLFLIRKDEKVVNVYPTVKNYDLNNLHLRCGQTGHISVSLHISQYIWREEIKASVITSSIIIDKNKSEERRLMAIG